MKTIKDLDLKDKNVLVRVDYNVPLKDGKVESDLRIRASLPTINYLLENKASKIILISHLGRPEGKQNEEFSLVPVAKELEKLLPGHKIGFYNLPKAGEKIEIPKDTKIVLLENLRFDPGEEANDKEFIKNIIDSVNADTFVQDGFAVVHRAHASTDAVKNFLPVSAGLLLEKEVTNLKKALENPEHPVVLIIGGAKVDDKQPLIDKFVNIADYILVGGKIAADGYKSDNAKIIVANDFDEDAEGAKLDIGPVSTAEFVKYLNGAKTIIWNGCLGKTEDPAFATASSIIADIIGKNQAATTIICGGDTTGFVENYMEIHKDLKYSLISTGGGASLEFLLGKTLPGLDF
ncbi:phosphoglycerate kinase [Candidatus Saccharibacteria bacterium]|nr:phosphoglycerate kinase [Candidatus Saccharibacteria bacterium]